MLPRVIIIGRPNVGKSTLFNRLIGKRLALVDDQPGVTRDRRFGDAELAGMAFTIVDTAGWEDEDPQSLPGRMRRQTEASLGDADAALFVVDARAGLTPLDKEIAQWLREQDVPVVLVVNKAEGRQGEAGVLESYSLGMGEPVPMSAEHGEGSADLFAALWPIIGAKSEGLEEDIEGDQDGLDPDGELEGDLEADLESDPDASFGNRYDLPEIDNEPTGPLKLAIVGRPNAGKSTLINRMLGEDRLLTGPEAGITRDSISADWQWQDPETGTTHQIELIDTAGMRKRAKVVDKLEKLSVADGLRAVDFAEVVVLLLDATQGLEHQDLKIADKALQEGRALIVAINKWDIARDNSHLYHGIRHALDEGLAQVRGVPLISVSALTGKGVDALIASALSIRKSWSRRVPTAALNRWFDDALEANPPPAPGGKRIKLRYITQVGTRPPRFVVFGTRLEALPTSYERYLVNSIRKYLGFQAVPVRVTLKSPKNPYDHSKN